MIRFCYQFHNTHRKRTQTARTIITEHTIEVIRLISQSITASLVTIEIMKE